MRRISFLTLPLALLLVACTGSNQGGQHPTDKDVATDSLSIDTLAANHPEYLPEIQLDTLAPDFAAPDTLGQVVRLSDYRGKYVIVDFWASWCGDCRREIPLLKQYYEEMTNTSIQGTPVQFLSLSFDSKAEQWKQYLAKEQLPWPQISTLEPKWQDNPVTQAYRLHWIPAFLVIDPEGKVVGKAITVQGLRLEVQKLSK